ncbi:hypothetical protein REJC140_03865 [Pseudorhizobium endolithicum]|uniref:Uncharacterized protein n=1 Tax=Pseudorhizobium endolithicum TaxID=1191678 RepID=A0ABM8PRP4_9HYPH|nr:hypothetical protein [Pseudorhizobium endolithicum]CAD7044765.1 hypothetical protein REJC140_03865 [Pseudorhizobium endolithicum]
MRDPKLELLQELAFARRQYDSDVRMGVSSAVGAVTKYVEALVDAGEADPQLLIPLINLDGALADAMRGISNEHIAVSKYEGGSKIPLHEAYAWGVASAVVSLHKEAGDDLATAVRRISVSRPHFESAKLKEYRKRISRGDRTVPPASLESYEDTLRIWKQADELTPRERASGALNAFQSLTKQKV